MNALRNIVCCLLLCFLAGGLWAQGGLVVDGAYMVVEANTDVRVEGGGVLHQTSGDITNNGRIYLDLDWTQTGLTSYGGTGWMWFEGSLNQYISGVPTVANLRVDNGNRLILQNPMTISNACDLTYNGSIELGPHSLYLDPGATLSNYDYLHYIITNGNGMLYQEAGGLGSVDFPIGSSSYNPAILLNIGTPDIYSMRVEDVVYDLGTSGTPLTTNLVNRSWHLGEMFFGGSDLSLTVVWASPDELSPFDRNNCGVIHHDGAVWDNAPSYTAATPYLGSYWSQSRTGITAFVSPFSVDDINNPLPVELLEFNARRKDTENVLLEWVTVNEDDNEGFFVERRLANETEFASVGWVEGMGTTANLTSYNLTDPNDFSGVSYYRLRQVDRSGDSWYSEIREVNGLLPDSYILFYPNPTPDALNILFRNIANDDVWIRIFSADGKLVYEESHVQVDNEVKVLDAVRDLPAGNYLVKLRLDDGSEVDHRFIRVRY